MWLITLIYSWAKSFIKGRCGVGKGRGVGGVWEGDRLARDVGVGGEEEVTPRDGNSEILRCSLRCFRGVGRGRGRGK